VLEPFASGVTTALIAITKELSCFRHIVIHGSRNGVESPETIKKRFPPGVEFVEWKSAGREISLFGDWKALRELIFILKPCKPRKKAKEKPFGGEKIVVHLHSSKAGFLGRLACRIVGIKPVIYTPHCGAFLRTDISPVKRNFFRFLEWLGGLFGGRVVGCGPSEGELYRSLGKNSAFVSNGVQPDASGTRLPGTSTRLISFTGIASFQKDPAMFSAIAADSAELSGNFAFYWIGDGPLEKELDRNFVTLTGWKGIEEVKKLLEKTAVYLSCSAWEGLPYGVLEAMNASCPLLLRNVPGNRDLVIPGENGWLFDSPEEAVDRLKTMLQDRPVLAAMGKRSREILEQKYSMKQMGEGYRRVYAEAAGEVV
jgi:glycosyltransferase involved in cell wall biosynthesis